MSTDSYKNAGVDITAGNELVDKIKPLAKSTSRIGANVNLGSFGGLFDIAACKYNDPVLVAANDGVGTKLKIAFEMNKHDSIGIDLVAMCVNDLIVQGAEPLFFLDYFATGGLDQDVAYHVIEGIAKGCKLSNSALIGGETAEMPGMYSKGHYDLAGFAVGAVERDKILPKNNIESGDTILGLASAGLHSNGFSLVRHLIEKNQISYHDKAPFAESGSLGDLILTPTKIYVKSCLEAIKTSKVKALAHITGGGFTENIPRILPDNLAASIDLSSWSLPKIFNWLTEIGNLQADEMLRTFNCGIGMVLIAKSGDVSEIKSILEDLDETVYEIGEIQERDKEQVVYLNKDSFNE